MKTGDRNSNVRSNVGGVHIDGVRRLKLENKRKFRFVRV